MKMKFPEQLEYWTLDEVAECLEGICIETRAKLWDLIPNITVEKSETPEPDSDDRAYKFIKKFWRQLTEEQQKEIVEASKNT